jgi:hypothetical protein
MTDLATRIADVEKKAEAALGLSTEHDQADAWLDYGVYASPDLFLAMAARIKELEKALEPFAEAHKGREGWDGDWTIGGSPLRNCHLRTAARAVKGEADS